MASQGRSSPELMLQIPGYTIIRELGRGGMATVYLAVQNSVNRRVALKVLLHSATGRDADISARFMREARIVAQLQHPNIVAIYDVSEFDAGVYMAMEYLPGGTLAERCSNTFIARDALLLIGELCNALDYAHARGFIHRDIKPDNILFREDDTLVLSDFGIARALQSDTRMTRTGMILGTPRYMSPEQIQGVTLDARSDLYSLGILCFQLLTGQTPFSAENVMAIGMQHLSQPVPELPKALAFLQPFVNKLLAKELGARYTSAVDVAEQVKAMLAENEAALDQCWFDAYRAPDRDGSTGHSLLELKHVKHPLVRPLILGGVLAVAAIFGYFLFNPFSQSLDSSSPQARLNSGSSFNPVIGNNALQLSTRDEKLARAQQLALEGKVLATSGEHAIGLYRELLKETPEDDVLSAALDTLIASQQNRLDLYIKAGDVASAEALLVALKQHTDLGEGLAVFEAKLMAQKKRIANAARVDEYLTLARAAEQRGELWQPRETNAAYYYGRILNLDPQDRFATTRLVRIKTSLDASIRDAIEEEQPEKASELLAYFDLVEVDMSARQSAKDTLAKEIAVIKSAIARREKALRDFVELQQKFSHIIDDPEMRADKAQQAVDLLNRMAELQPTENVSPMQRSLEERVSVRVGGLIKTKSFDDALALMDAAESLLGETPKFRNFKKDIEEEKNSESLMPLSF